MLKNLLIVLCFLCQGTNLSAQLPPEVSTILQISPEGTFIRITNHSNTAIVINKFLLGVSIFSIEIQTDEGTIKTSSGTPPPLPPADLHQYEAVLNSNQAVNIPLSISFLDNIEEKSIKLSAKITYRHLQNSKEHTQFSPWVTYRR